jgi:hypothetical protein
MTITNDEFDSLCALTWHRYLTLEQHKRLVPLSSGWDTSRGYAGRTYDLLNSLKRRGYVNNALIDARAVRIWFATDKGLAVVPEEYKRDYVPSKRMATGSNWKHTHAVNMIAIAFSEVARARDDDCGVFALEHERLLRPGTGQAKVTADGILQYTGMGLTKPGYLDVAWAIVELDRTTSIGRIALRLRAYAEIRRKPSLWRKVIPGDWPPILFVVTADPKTGPKCGEKNWPGDPARAQARCNRLAASVGAMAEHEKGLRDLEVLFCPLPQLIAQGPFAPIWRRPGHAEGLDWTGKPAMHLIGESREAGAQ